MTSIDDKADPMLKATMSEILEICRNRQVCAHVILASKTHGEYEMFFASWSKAQFEEIDGKRSVRFKAKGKDEDQTVAATVHMFQVYQTVSNNLFLGMVDLFKKLKDLMKIEGGPRRIG
jgi:hypothetical protein